MSLKAKELREQRAPIKAKIDAMAATIAKEGRGFTAEERTNFDAMAADYTAKTLAISDIESASALTAGDDSRTERGIGREDTNPAGKSRKGRREDERAAPTEEDRALAFQAWVRRSNKMTLKNRHVEACRKTGFNPNRRDLIVRLGPVNPSRRIPWQGMGESRDMGLTANVGGSTVPTDFMAKLEVALTSFDGAAQVADIIRTDNGRSLPWPTLNDTSNTGELLAENTAAASATPATSSKTFGAYKFSSKLIPVSNELMQDSAFAMAGIVGDLAGTRLGRIRNTYHTTGTGSSQPEGIVTGAAAGVTAAGATAIALADLEGLRGSVDPAYRSDPSCGWMFHDNILTYLLKLQDSTGRPLIRESARDGTPDKLLGHPFAINQGMQSSVATATKTVLFGVMKSFKIREVGQVRLRRLDERYAEYDQTGFLAFIRCDSKVLTAGVNPLKYLTQA